MTNYYNSSANPLASLNTQAPLSAALGGFQQGSDMYNKIAGNNAQQAYAGGDNSALKSIAAYNPNEYAQMQQGQNLQQLATEKQMQVEGALITAGVNGLQAAKDPEAAKSFFDTLIKMGDAHGLQIPQELRTYGPDSLGKLQQLQQVLSYAGGGISGNTPTDQIAQTYYKQYIASGMNPNDAKQLALQKAVSFTNPNIIQIPGYGGFGGDQLPNPSMGGPDSNPTPSPEPQTAAQQILFEQGTPIVPVQTRQDVAGRNAQATAYRNAATAAKGTMQQLDILNAQSGKFTPGKVAGAIYSGESSLGMGGGGATARTEADKAAKALANSFMQANVGAKGAGIRMVEFDAGAVPNADMTDEARTELIKKNKAIADSQIQRAAISDMYPRMHISNVNTIMDTYETANPPILTDGKANDNWMPYKEWLKAGRPDNSTSVQGPKAAVSDSTPIDQNETPVDGVKLPEPPAIPGLQNPEKPAAAALAMPKDKSALVVGQVYNTPRGKAVWKGNHFESAK